MLETSPNNLIKRDELTPNFHQVLKQNHKNHYPTSGYWKQICISFSGTEISLGEYFSERSACVSYLLKKPPCQALDLETGVAHYHAGWMRFKSNLGDLCFQFSGVRALQTLSSNKNWYNLVTLQPVLQLAGSFSLRDNIVTFPVEASCKCSTSLCYLVGNCVTW